MKRFIAILLAACVLMPQALCLAQEDYAMLQSVNLPKERFYQNPMSLSGIGDPCILKVGDTYYCYATGGGVDKGFCVWKTKDLGKWSSAEKIHCFTGTGWATANYWAPEVHVYQDQYVLVYSAQYGEKYDLRLGIAFADSPEGPFVDPLGKPWLDTDYCAIDSHLFVDDDGTPYLFYVRDNFDNPIGDHLVSQTHGVQLTPDLLSAVGEPVLLTTPENDWELKSGRYIWNEGVYVLKNGGRYYLYFSANYTSTHDYCVGVAEADFPLGPYTKPEANPLLAPMTLYGRNDVIASGPGHNAFFTVGEELFTSYHVNTSNEDPTMNRTLCVDRAGFHADGSAYINGPSVMKRQLRPLSDLGLYNAALTASCDDETGLLTDGDYCISDSSANHVWRGKQVCFTWNEAVCTDMLMIYPQRGAQGTGRVVFNEEHEIAFDLSEPGTMPGAAVILCYEPLQAVSCRIELDAEATLGEILILAQNPQ